MEQKKAQTTVQRARKAKEKAGKAEERVTKMRMHKTEQGVQDSWKTLILESKKKRSNDSAATSTKRLRLHDELNDNVCSICFGLYRKDIVPETS